MIVRSILAYALVLGVTGSSAVGSCARREPAASIVAAINALGRRTFIYPSSSGKPYPGDADAVLPPRRATKDSLRPDVNVEPAECQLLQTQSKPKQIAAQARYVRRGAVDVPHDSRCDEGYQPDPLKHGDRERQASIECARMHALCHVGSVAETKLCPERARRCLVTHQSGDG